MTRPPRFADSASDPSDPAPPQSGRADGQVAVALSWDGGDSSAPRITATGRGHVAERILELAFAHGVRVRQDADLAQILAALDVDSEIPLEAFAAVAEVLAYVYQANHRWPEHYADTPTEAPR
ncbi:EscU/YscU/HrcU family type III secretion system export apparatus switch protein [Roseospirillum parvum]|uniref:Flagellar biosynthesis protein n=1 Tax=Roseospirillum parvum TaxID=83401 RepID=A0A1G8DHS9_9PROT|nr:EscU/YscU/HrcU family type III secretion system export apparatus switch protein [Roseospirillum parvum]SDH57212.1 flagellar biosynthesis protein [Roseospirillum parvum]